MKYRHKSSNDEYVVIMKSFDVQTQKMHYIYVKLKTGEVFNRECDIFHEKFEFVSDVQSGIIPNPPAASEEQVQNFVKRVQEVIVKDLKTRDYMLALLDANGWRTIRDIPPQQFEDVLMQLTMHTNKLEEALLVTITRNAKALSLKHGQTKLTALLKEFGVDNIAGLDTSRYDDFNDRLNEEHKK